MTGNFLKLKRVEKFSLKPVARQYQPPWQPVSRWKIYAVPDRQVHP